MKTKTLYFIIFLLAIIMIFALIYTKAKVSELNQQVPESIRVEVSEQGSINETTGPVFFHKEAITVVKPAQGRKAAVAGLDKEIDTLERENTEISSLSASQASGGVKSKDSSEEAAGVTRLGKYPTKEEINEMNAKGIIIY
jgi:hypothetical protein